MKRVKPTWVLLAVLLPFSLAGTCGNKPPATLGEKLTGHAYVPTDPFPVKIDDGKNCNGQGAGGNRSENTSQANQTKNTLRGKQTKNASTRNQPETLAGNESTKSRGSEVTTLAVEPGADPKYVALLKALPDNTMRFSVQQFKGSGSVTFGSSAITAEGSSYRAVADYVNATTISVPFEITRETLRSQAKRKKKRKPPGDASGKWRNRQATSAAAQEPASTYKWTAKLAGTCDGKQPPKPGGNKGGIKETYRFCIPVYVGIGLRLTAEIVASKAGVNISGMSAVGVQADFEGLSGSMVVQTLGVNGERVTATLPFPSELNNTAVINAMMSLAEIKGMLFDDETYVHPRVVGFSLPMQADIDLVKQIVGQLMKTGAVKWKRPCKVKPSANGSHSHASGSGSHAHAPPQ